MNKKPLVYHFATGRLYYVADARVVNLESHLRSKDEILLEDALTCVNTTLPTMPLVPCPYENPEIYYKINAMKNSLDKFKTLEKVVIR